MVIVTSIEKLLSTCKIKQNYKLCDKAVFLRKPENLDICSKIPHYKINSALFYFF